MYRIETNDTRTPVTKWSETVPNNEVAAMNLQAYRNGMGGLFGVYRQDGTRVVDEW